MLTTSRPFVSNALCVLSQAKRKHSRIDDVRQYRTVHCLVYIIIVFVDFVFIFGYVFTVWALLSWSTILLILRPSHALNSIAGRSQPEKPCTMSKVESKETSLNIHVGMGQGRYGCPRVYTDMLSSILIFILVILQYIPLHACYLYSHRIQSIANPSRVVVLWCIRRLECMLGGNFGVKESSVLALLKVRTCDSPWYRLFCHNGGFIDQIPWRWAHSNKSCLQ